jgi:RNA polymerase sigma factor (TIGR02999 family)
MRKNPEKAFRPSQGRASVAFVTPGVLRYSPRMPRRRHRPPPGERDLEERRALDELFTATYLELKRLASRKVRRERSLTVKTTTLVHEAWLKLADYPQLAGVPRTRFVQIAGKAMRQVLVEAARRRMADKRGGDAAIHVRLDDLDEEPAVVAHDMLGLDAALERLARVDAHAAALVEARYFGGFTVPELAELLGTSESSIEKDWRAARAFLASQVPRRS